MSDEPIDEPRLLELRRLRQVSELEVAPKELRAQVLARARATLATRAPKPSTRWLHFLGKPSAPVAAPG